MTESKHKELQTRLNKVLETGSPEEIIEEANYAIHLFHFYGFPNDYNRWEKALNRAREEIVLKNTCVNVIRTHHS